MKEFWNNLFVSEGALWDFSPSDSALIALDLFSKRGVKKILIPGVGYGRNAKLFFENGYDVTGIEVSERAIELAKENKLNFNIYNGSLLEMPFDSEKYEGIFCYATLHLFNKTQRYQIIKTCYNQLSLYGLMFFNIVSFDAIDDFKGTINNDNTKLLENGLKLFFSDIQSIANEFGDFNIIDISKIEEPIKHMKDQRPLKCFNIICEKL